MLVDKVEVELKKESLTTNELSELLGEEEMKIEKAIQELEERGLIKKKRVSSEKQDVYRIKKRFRDYTIILILSIFAFLNFIFTLLYILLSLTSGRSIGDAFRFYMSYF